MQGVRFRCLMRSMAHRQVYKATLGVSQFRQMHTGHLLITELLTDRAHSPHKEKPLSRIAQCG
jgi:hypothetical protein